jgi:HAD superfamily hydrolase (TIGR01509 family)
VLTSATIARMPPAAALFDNDGLTLDTESVWTRAETELFARHGQTFTKEHKHAMLGTSPEVSALKLEQYLGRPGDELMTELYAVVLDQAAAGIEPMPGAVALLDALRAAGVALALVSNSRRRFVELAIASAGLADMFDTIVTAEDVPRPKPAPDAYLAAARELGVEAAACVILEDSPTGVAAGRATGALTIGIPSLPGMALDADLVATSLEDDAVWRALGLEAAAA